MEPEGNFTARLAEYCATSRIEDIPEAVRQRAKYVILDGLGCGIYGARLPWSEILTKTIAGFGSGGPTAVWGTDLSLPPDHAALLNGSFVQGFELDDYHREGGLHECANVLPPALAALDVAGPVPGADLLTAIVVGFEVGARVGQCMGAAAILVRGWHGGAVVGVHAAAAGAGRVLGLSPEQMAHAFGIAATQAAGLMSAQFGSMVKRMHHGRSSQSGFYAAALARNGYTGIERVFEERYGGYCTTFTGTRDQFDLTRLVDGLGSRWEVDRIAIKPYACNGSVQPSLDAIRAIKARRPFRAEEVRQVTVRCTKATEEHVGWRYEPSSMTAAQMNLSFGVAVMLEFGDAFVEQYTEENIHSPKLLELTRKVSIVHEPAFDALGPRHRHHVELTVELADGTRETETVVAARGSSAHPLTNEEIAAKYDRLARTVLSPGQADRLKEAVVGMEGLADSREISQLLRASSV